MLHDLRVIEFCQVAAGPYAALLLADLGAEVIKVEPEQGDAMRSWPPINGGFSENFASLNRNKRSIVLDLKSPSGLASALQLTAGADVVIENNRPGVMERLGLSYNQVKAENPKLVYCSISAFGQTGPRAKDGGFDVTVQAASGVMSVTGDEQGAPVKAGVPVSDFCAGLYAAYSIMAAVRQADASGQGAYIDMSMLGASLGISALQTSEFFGSGLDPRKLGSAHPRNAPYQAFKARDDYFVLAAGNDKLWASVCEVLGRDDLRSDSRFASTAQRAAHQIELKELLETIFQQSSAEHWISTLRGVGVPCEPIARYSQALAEPQVQHSEWVSDLELPGGHVTRTFGFPGLIDGEAPKIYRRPPALGEHTDEVLAEMAADTLVK